MAKRVAVIDIGSNSTRLSIYEKSSRFAFRVLHELKSKVRISEGAYNNNSYLQEIPMQRAIDALCDFSSLIKSYKATKTLCVATSALRDAPNRADFIKRVKQSSGLNIKVIDGTKEAYLGALACALLLSEEQNAISLDIGGGSCEVALIENSTIANPISLDIGTVRLKELYFDHLNISGAKEHISKELSKLPPQILPKTIIGIGGTFRAISTLLLKDYPIQRLHGFKPPTAKFKSLLQKISTANDATLKKLGISASRFDIIRSGALILLCILEKFNDAKLITSNVGVREGLFLQDLLRNSNHKFPLNFNPSIRYIQDVMLTNKLHNQQINRCVKDIFALTHKKLHIDKKYLKPLEYAAKIYGCNNHTRGSIENILEYGFTHKQIALIAAISSYASNSTYDKKLKTLLPNEETVEYLGYTLRVGVLLLLHHPRNIDFKLSFSDKTLLVHNSTSAMYAAKEAISKEKNSNIFDVLINAHH